MSSGEQQRIAVGGGLSAVGVQIGWIQAVDTAIHQKIDRSHRSAGDHSQAHEELLIRAKHTVPELCWHCAGTVVAQKSILLGFFWYVLNETSTQDLSLSPKTPSSTIENVQNSVPAQCVKKEPIFGCE